MLQRAKPSPQRTYRAAKDPRRSFFRSTLCEAEKLSLYYLMLLKNTSSIVIACLACVMAGCIDIVEEIFINKDGSGIYRYSLQMSDEQQAEAFLKDKGSFYDTTFRVADMQDPVVHTFKYPDIMKKVSVRMQAQKSGSSINVTIELPFDHPGEIAMFQKDMARYDSTFFSVHSHIELSNGKLIHRRIPNPFLQEEKFNLIATRLLKDATFKTIYHLPRRIRKHNIPQGTASKKELTQRLMYLDVINGSLQLQNEITFR